MPPLLLPPVSQSSSCTPFPFTMMGGGESGGGNLSGTCLFSRTVHEWEHRAHSLDATCTSSSWADSSLAFVCVTWGGLVRGCLAVGPADAYAGQSSLMHMGCAGLDPYDFCTQGTWPSHPTIVMVMGYTQPRLFLSQVVQQLSKDVSVIFSSPLILPFKSFSLVYWNINS